MGLFDFLFKSNKGEEKSEKSNYNSSSKDSYSHYKKATIDNWHDAVGISISDEFEATVCERRGYGIIVSFMHNGKEYRGLVHNSNMTYGKIKDSTDLFSDGEKVWVVVMGFDEKERIKLKLKYFKKGDVEPVKQQVKIGTKCNCTIKEVRDTYVIVAIEGYEGITGYIGIQEMSHAFVQHPSFMFKEDEHISAITISQAENGKAQLSFKETQDTSVYQVGQDIGVRWVDTDVERQNLIVITQDSNKILGYVPYKEISWTNDISLQERCFKVRIKSIDTSKNRYKLTCSIRDRKENPWKKAIYKEGQEIPVIVDSYTEKCVKIITDDKYNLPGIIKKDQITWLKNESEITEEDYPPKNSKITVLILKFVADRQIMSCSIRELQDNPWMHIKIGDTVKGKVYKKSNLCIVRLNSGIECECHDKTKFDSYKEYKFIVTDIDIQKKRIEVSTLLLQRADYYAKITTDFFKQRSPSLHIIRWKKDDKQTICVLLPQCILFKGESIAPPYLNICIQILENNTPLHFKEIMRSDINPSIVFVSVDMADTGLTMPTIDLAKMRRRELCAKVIFETKNYLIVSAVGVLGYFEKPEYFKIKQNEVKVMFVNEQDTPLQLYKFNLIYEDKENGFIKEFLKEDEKKVIDEKDLALINSLQEDIPSITRENCHVFNEEVCLVYDMALESQINHFFEKEGRDLSLQNFWLSMRTDKGTGKQTVAIFNSNDSILLCNADDDSFFIKGVYCSKEKTQAQSILNRFSRGNNLVLPGAKLRICKYLNTNNFNFAHLNSVLSQQYTIVAKILPELSSKVKNRKEAIGQEYLVVSSFLQFQKNKEERRLQNLELAFGPNSCRLGTFENYGCIVLESVDCSSFFADNEDRQAIKLIPLGTEKEIPGILTKDEDNYSVYFKSEQELSTYCHDGFTLTPAANVYHLKIQDASVKEFVFNNPLLDKLNDGTLCPPQTDDNIVFFNPIFNQVEEGNNQPIAIRKAVGNQDIFLIQGPPGTGKTSVIVEIIRQLVRKGERVLVCSQAHSAVKNIYDRVLDADNSIRVGFLDDEKTMQAIAFDDHKKFLKRNILILNSLRKEGGNPTDIISSYNDYPYYLQDFYQGQHHLLLQDAIDQTDSCSYMIEIADDFLKEIEKSNADGDNRFYMASHIHSLQVVMGTCIGIGTNPTIKKSGIKFDTLIIDEAGKANMAETNVPMNLAKKYILVGDHNQLPPYMDVQEVEEFKNSDEAKEKDDIKIKSALSTSLFEDFLNDPSFPEESKILLNYQYRMNPTIGKMVSELFYNGNLNNGTGTEKQTCELEDFQAPVIFYDTGRTLSMQNYNPYEQNTGNGSIYNSCEIDIICNKIVPKIENLLINDSNLSIGIVTPYSEQVRRLKKELRGSAYHLENCVYTIDNIQGQEYDIVILSFVRSFRGKRKVGFLDDLRRLNVALSRAKKKLIMVGNLETLCRPEAHRPNGLGGKLPEEVFASLKKVCIRYAEYNYIDKFKQNGIRPGYIFKKCPITIKKDNKNQLRCVFTTKIKGAFGKEDIIKLPFPAYPYGNTLLQEGECFDFRYTCEYSQGSDRPQFEIVSQKVEAKILNCHKNIGAIELQDGSTKKVMFDNKNWILKQILSEDGVKLAIPLIVKGHLASLDTEELQQRVNNISGNRFVVQIIGTNTKGYWVWSLMGRVIGFIVKHPRLPLLNIGDTLDCSIYKKDKERITFNYLRKIR